VSDTPVDTTRDGSLILATPVALPDVLDVLIAGGGPFGTATAFRAKELGLTALVIDYDDLMKRIRDYAKDKQILPDYGGGDRMQFPQAGPLIARLQFAPIDKDQMCKVWRALYREHSVPAQIGIELTGLERDGEVWKAITWNHNLKAEQIYRARHVVLAFGRGVPRRLDIPGDLGGLAFGLTDAANYIGGPVCVIGGGTSAGEAVIAISNAKSSANDATAVYWSYRGEKMPKVSKALAELFFDAFIGNGNVRYLPSSEPVAIIEADGRDHLSVRTARVAAPGKPAETTQLEFPTTFCIACIGEDMPENLLARVGVPLVTGGAANKSRPVVTPLLETRQPNVYLAGDVLSPVYFETTDFDRDPSKFLEVKRRGNIKAALRDGVLVAEVIKQKLEGRVHIDVKLQFAEPESDAVVQAPPPSPASVTSLIAGKGVAAAAGVVPASHMTPAEKLKSSCSLVSIQKSGVEANEYALKPDGATTVGRNADISFPQDAALADVQFSIVPADGRYVLQYQGTESGMLFQADADRSVELERGAVIRAGRQWLVVGDRTSDTTVVHYNEAGARMGSFVLKPGATVVGRESPDVTIAPTDAALSRRHLALTLEGNVIAVKDLGSANGTQVKVSRPMRLRSGDRILVGQQVLEFRDDRRIVQPPTDVSLETGSALSHPALAQHLAAATQGAAATAESPGVFFEGLNRLAPCPAGQTICEAAEKAGIKLDADCHQGVCGMDPVKVIAGGEYLTAIGSTERSTLEDLCSLEPGPYRLACMARVSGRVRVQIVKS
jgi:thioredoxin reductase/ferredoxin